MGLYTTLDNIPKESDNLLKPMRASNALLLSCILLNVFFLSCESTKNQQTKSEGIQKHEFAFIRKYQYSVEQLFEPFFPALMDADSDGDLDGIIAQLRYPGTPCEVAALRNDGSGYFELATKDLFRPETVLMEWPRDAVKADFNGDGMEDLLIADHGPEVGSFPGGLSKLLMKSPEGILLDETKKRLPQLRSCTHSVTAGDIDNDGDIDIFMGNVAGGTMPPCFYMNNGSGFFSADLARLPETLVYRDELDLKYTSSLLLDVDKDGDLDLIGGLHGGYPKDNPFYQRDDILLNNGSGYFSFSKDSSMPPRYKDGSWGTIDTVAADFNNDGLADLLLAVCPSSGDSGIQLLLGTGNGTFHDKTENIPQDFKGLDGGVWLNFTADFNGDGWVDFIANDSGPGPHLYINSGNAVFQDRSEMLSIYEKDTFVLPGDLDNDSDIDLFVVKRGMVMVFLNQLK